MQVFTIAPAGMKPWWVFLAAGVLLASIFAMLAVSMLGSRTARFEVDAGGLRIRGDFYGRRIPAAVIRADEARRVDLASEPELRPKLRTWGTGLPGYQAGWFRLASGEKALLYVTDRRKMVYVPTTAGYGLLLSPDDPDGFVSALKGMAR